MIEDLCYLTATEALRRFRNRSLSPVKLLEAQIKRAREVESKVNAFTFTYFDEALQQANLAEKAYANGTARPLEGLTVAIKDESMIAGQPTSNGSHFMTGYVPTTTDPIAERIIEAGAIVHARTATPEFSMTIVTWSKLWGVTRNPWNLDISPGGSSGGAGAALASGMTTLATGSDIGGSIRVPAAMNGVVGFKPPYGRIPEFYPWNRETYAQGGPMARCVSDLVLLQNIISGQHPGDICSLPKVVLPESYEPIKDLKIALSLDLGCFEIDEEIREATLAAALSLRVLGATIVLVELDWDSEHNDIAFTHLRFQAGSVLDKIVGDGDREKLTPYIRDYLDGVEDLSLEDEKQSWAYSDEMYAELRRKVFDAGYSALICPTMASTRLPAEFDHSKDRVMINGKEQGIFGIGMTTAFNMLGRLPVINIPIAQAENNVPIGLQVVGDAYADKVVFQIAKAYQEAYPFCYQVGTYPVI